MTIEATTNSTPQTTYMTKADLREAGFTPREIYRLQALRDCIELYPHIEFFGSEEWKQLLFLKWRVAHGNLSHRPGE